MSYEREICDVCGAAIDGRVRCTDEYENPLCAACVKSAHEAGALERTEDGSKVEPWESIDDD